MNFEAVQLSSLKLSFFPIFSVHISPTFHMHPDYASGGRGENGTDH